MTLVLQEAKTFAERILVHAGGWACTERGCKFQRKYATAAGALNGAIEHMARKHGITISLPRTQPPQNAGAAIQARIESALARQRVMASVPAEPDALDVSAAVVWGLFL